MSMSLKSAASRARLEQTRADSPVPSGSLGVDVSIKGWRPGMNKVRLTQTLRDGGLGLRAASQQTGELLKGGAIRVRLQQFDSVTAARAALTAVGVLEVSA